MRPLGSSARNRWTVSETTRQSGAAADRRRGRSRVQADGKLVTLRSGAHAPSSSSTCRTTSAIPKGWLAHIGVDVDAGASADRAAASACCRRCAAHDVPVIWLNWGNRPDRLNLSPALLHVYKPSGAGVGLGDPLPGSGAKVLERGSWSAAIVDELGARPSDIHVAKYRMSGFQDTELDSILRNLGVTTLLFAGVNADQCVLCTLQDANFRGYDCLLLEDCAATTSPDYCMAATIYNVRQCFGFVVQLAVDDWPDSPAQDCRKR